MPPLPKHQPQRRNKTTTRATLSAVHDIQAPLLPEDGERQWHEQTRSWWADTWASPMAPEFDASDRHGLFLLAVLVDDFWHKPTWALAAEIRLQRQCFGLTPIDRRRLQWEIERVDEAQDRGRRRRSAGAGKPPADPLAALHAV
jgi:hypothetical protein